MDGKAGWIAVGALIGAAVVYATVALTSRRSYDECILENMRGAGGDRFGAGLVHQSRKRKFPETAPKG